MSAVTSASSTITSAMAGNLALRLAARCAPLIADAYGLTSRERDVVRLVLQGLSTDRIAGELYVSSWTVQDHLKSIFDKVGVRSRKALVAQIFFQQYQPRITDDGFNLGPNGWFAEP